MAFFHSNFMLQIPHHHQDHDHNNNQPSTSLPPINPQQFNGVGSLLGKRSSMAFSGMNGCDEEMDHHHNHNHHNHHHQHGNGEDELSDDGSQLGEKKRRLSMEQVRTLEKNFELGNKLEPERKMQLARALGLQPRQVAIWFQNRRARWKTKTLEKDYELLKRQFESVKAQNDALQAHNLKLHAQILALKTREPTESINLNKETEGSCSNRSENSSDIIKLDISRNNNNHNDNNNNNDPAIDSPLSANIANRPLFPTGMIRPPPNVAQQLFHNSSRAEMQCGGKNMDQIVNKEESLCNIMFSGMDDQAAAGFWPWLDQQHFN